jgi:hypothetical protein
MDVALGLVAWGGLLLLLAVEVRSRLRRAPGPLMMPDPGLSPGGPDGTVARGPVPPPDAAALEDGLDDEDWVRLLRALRAGVSSAEAYRLMRLRAAVRRQGDPAQDEAAALRSTARGGAGPGAEAGRAARTRPGRARHAGPADAERGAGGGTA